MSLCISRRKHQEDVNGKKKPRNNVKYRTSKRGELEKNYANSLTLNLEKLYPFSP
jgi:hypothetical protein